MAHHPLLLGHRGMRGSPEVKENTIEAFDLALQHGCHGFEFDVRLTGDRRAVINQRGIERPFPSQKRIAA